MNGQEIENAYLGTPPSLKKILKINSWSIHWKNIYKLESIYTPTL